VFYIVLLYYPILTDLGRLQIKIKNKAFAFHLWDIISYTTSGK